MKNDNKRIINVRPLFLVFVAFGTGIICSYSFLSAVAFKQFNLTVLIVPIIMLVFFIFTALLFLQKKIYNRYLALLFFINKNYKYILTFLLALIIGVGAGFLHTHQFASLKHYRNEQCEISGKVIDVDGIRIVLKDVFVKDDTTSLKSGCVVYINNEETAINVGDRVSLAGQLSLQPLYSNKVNIARYLSSNAYQFKVENNGLKSITKGDLTFSEQVRLKVFNLLSKNMNSENTSVSMSILFGVKQDFPYEVSEAFSLVGISHILAVSGFHVGILMTAIFYVLNIIFKRKSWLQFFIILMFVAFYCYLCDFTYSVMRASIMGLVLIASQQLGRRYDGLSSLSLAGIIILILMPLAVFSVGFQMSFLCVFAIITLAPLLTKSFQSIKMSSKLASALAISIAVNTVLFPLSANIFNKVSIISVFANIIIIPIFTLVFVSLLSILAVSIILPIFSFLLFVPSMFLHIIKFIADALSKMPFAYINIFHVGYFIVILTILLAFLIKYLMVENNIKILISGAFIFIIIIVTVFSNTAVTSTTNKVFIDYQKSSNYAFVINDKSEMSLIGFSENTYYITQSMTTHRIKNIKNIIAYDFDLTALPSLVQFTNINKVDNVYLPSYYKSSAELFEKVNSNLMFTSSGQYVDDYYLNEYTDFNNKPLALSINIANKQLLFIKKLNNAQFLYLANNLEDNVDYVISNNIKHNYSDHLDVFDCVIYHNENKTQAKESIDLYSHYSFTMHL